MSRPRREGHGRLPSSGSAMALDHRRQMTRNGCGCFLRRTHHGEAIYTGGQCRRAVPRNGICGISLPCLTTLSDWSALSRTLGTCSNTSAVLLIRFAEALVPFALLHSIPLLSSCPCNHPYSDCEWERIQDASVQEEYCRERRHRHQRRTLDFKAVPASECTR